MSKKGGWGITPVSETIEIRRLEILRKYFAENQQHQSNEWVQLGQHMAQATQKGWAHRRENKFFGSHALQATKTSPATGQNYRHGGEKRGIYG